MGFGTRKNWAYTWLFHLLAALSPKSLFLVGAVGVIRTTDTRGCTENYVT